MLRTILRLHYRKRLFVDDGFLIFAVLVASASLGVYFKFMDSLYLTATVENGRIPQAVSVEAMKSAGLDLHKFASVYIELTWTCTFAVKLSFLAFFKSLISRVPSMELVWRCVVGMTIISWVVVLVVSMLACPHFDERACMLYIRYPSAILTVR